MPLDDLRLNRNGEAWDTVSGFVYNDDGTVLRAGLPGATALSTDTVAAAIAAGLQEA